MVAVLARSAGALLRHGLADATPDAGAAGHAAVSGAFGARRARWALLRSWYDGTAYDADALPAWRRYREDRRLPRHLRAEYNPVRRAVDWYPGHVYRGAWSPDGAPLPGGADLAVPVADDDRAARPAAVAAMFQALDWGNWRVGLADYAAGSALYGNAFVEVVDDPARGKVWPRRVPLGHVADLALDAAGNVKRYALDYPARAASGTAYAHRKEIDAVEVRTFRDGAPLSRDAHGYGFCPGVWVLHAARTDPTGSGDGVFGEGAVGHVLPKLDAINGLAAFVRGAVGRGLNTPVVLTGGAPGGSLRKIFSRAPDGSGPERPLAEDELAFYGWDGAGVVPLVPQVDVAGAQAAIRALLDEVEADLPEIVMDRELRGMSALTGPAADRVMGDTRPRYEEAMANLDAGLVKLMQMGAAVGGMRAHAGDWGGDLTRQQAKFLAAVGGRPLGLDSYARGDLDVAIVPRPLIPETAAERAALVLAKERAETGPGLAELWGAEAGAAILAERAAAADRLDAGLGGLAAPDGEEG